MKTHVATILTATLLASFGSSCATSRADVAWPEPRPLGAGHETFMPPAKPGGEEQRGPEPTGFKGDLTLERALSLALKYNQGLAAAAWDVRAREAGVEQAGLFPNPSLDVDVEEFGGTGALSGFRSAQTTATLSQPFPVGGRIGNQTRVAKIERDLAGWDWESRRLDLITRTSRAFVLVQAAQARLDLAQESSDLAQRVLEAVSLRVEAGKVSPVQRMRARVARSTSVIELNRAEKELDAARRALAATWGGSSPSFGRALGGFETVSAPPRLEDLVGSLSANPDLARWEREVSWRDARVGLEKSLRMPDVTLSAGVQRLEDTGDFAAIVGLSIPFPVFNHNQGNIRRAEFERSAAIARKSDAEVRASAALESAWQRLSAAYKSILSLRDEALEGAREAFEASRAGYEQGKFQYLEMLDAQRTLFDVRASYVSALTSYHEALIDCERLVGRRLHSNGSNVTEENEHEN